MSAPDRGLLYTTLRGEGHGELEDRRSVFLSHASPVTVSYTHLTLPTIRLV